ncbi:MAG: VWA domain-containing protein [Chloroflexi bacterium]|nr:VWA domain-containing protein [Chloroflexota bacterium]
MTFIWPKMLFSLLLLPVALLLYWRMQRKREKDLLRLGTLGIVSGLEKMPLRRAQALPRIIFFGGLAILLFSTARPEMVVALPRIEGTVILAFDVSASMAADDFAPTRMDAAKRAAKGFVAGQPSTVRIGVVSFSDGGLIVQSPTDDREAILATIDRLVPQSGTSIGQGILVSLSALGNPEPVAGGVFAPALILMLTDGENTTLPDPLEAAQFAIDRGVRIYTVGVGSASGTEMKLEGFLVFTRLDEELLQNIASLTEAEYFNAENEADLTAIYENVDLQFVAHPKKMEITSLLAGLSMIVLLIGAAFSLVWFGRIV